MSTTRADGEKEEEPLTFPDGFIWGSATAAYQIEGACGEDGKGASIWDHFSHERGRVWREQNGDVACDHYHRLEEDVQRMKDMGLRAYRFSFSWPRLFPDGALGSERPEGVGFYRRLLRLLKEAGIEAMATLYHWDLPLALHEHGGWCSAESPAWFEAYARRCFELFDSDVHTWITMNEPWCICALGYGSGAHAPGRSGAPGTEPYLAAHHVLLAHARAYRVYKAGGDALDGARCAARSRLTIAVSHRTSGEWRYRYGSKAIGITLNCEYREAKGRSARRAHRI